MRYQQGILLICSDSVLIEKYQAEFELRWVSEKVIQARSLAEARESFRRCEPAVILLDESAVPANENDSLNSTVSMLTEVSPVVVVAQAGRQLELAFLITAGAVDFVERSGNFIPIAAGWLERRLKLGNGAMDADFAGTGERLEDFGEFLRHEVNNPLTGILGNAELLLARRDRLSPSAVTRVETIAELALRLRETLRRFSSDRTPGRIHASSR